MLSKVRFELLTFLSGSGEKETVSLKFIHLPWEKCWRVATPKRKFHHSRLQFPQEGIKQNKNTRNLRACDKSSAAFFRRSADGSCKHGTPGPSRFTLQNERFARPYHLLIMGPSGLELFEDPAPCSEVLLDEIDYIKASHLSYDCTMSHSCLLGFLCQNLFQRAIFCSLKQCSFRRSIQRVTLTTRQRTVLWILMHQFAISFPDRTANLTSTI